MNKTLVFSLNNSSMCAQSALYNRGNNCYFPWKCAVCTVSEVPFLRLNGAVVGSRPNKDCGDSSAHQNGIVHVFDMTPTSQGQWNFLTGEDVSKIR